MIYPPDNVPLHAVYSDLYRMWIALSPIHSGLVCGGGRTKEEALRAAKSHLSLWYGVRFYEDTD